MNRREFVAAASLSTFGLAGCIDYVDGLAEEFTEPAFIEEVRWVNGDILPRFRDGHESDGFTITHEDGDSEDDVIIAGESPEGGDRIRLPIADVLTETERTFDTPFFAFHFWTGSFREFEDDDPIIRLDEHLGSTRFFIPEEHRPSGVIE